MEAYRVSLWRKASCPKVSSFTQFSNGLVYDDIRFTIPVDIKNFFGGNKVGPNTNQKVNNLLSIYHQMYPDIAFF